ncbi:12938_t:CDS:1 [Cetraspora pellucida]|uniref:12938_t:CDS:1 n=1 Tax=Cetraspora pellucida TaxID=1433469 RepID=A0A9N9ENS8_9GLOM|nr:12938_t:CDS:1 [Cetraspora pellucida]
MRAKITAEMSQAIKVYTFDLEELIDESFYEKENYKIENRIYRSLKDILNYTIPAWLENGGLSIQNSVLRIQLSGDRHNVGKKIKHVMVIFTLLNNSLNYYEPDYHYTLILYLGIESYETLKLATKLLIKDLNNIKTRFIDYQRRK